MVEGTDSVPRPLDPPLVGRGNEGSQQLMQSPRPRVPRARRLTVHASRPRLDRQVTARCTSSITPSACRRAAFKHQCLPSREWSPTRRFAEVSSTLADEINSKANPDGVALPDTPHSSSASAPEPTRSSFVFEQSADQPQPNNSSTSSTT